MMYKYMNKTTLGIIGLFAGDYSAAMHTREIARAIGVDVKAVQIQLKRLEADGILLSRTSGRNTEYRLNLGNTNTRYGMVLAEYAKALALLERNFAIKRFADATGKDADCILVLFGSFAAGNEDKASDIDLLVIAGEKMHRRAFGEAGKTVGREVNPVFMDAQGFMAGLRANDPLVKEAMKRHIVLSGADRFCAMVWDYYAAR